MTDQPSHQFGSEQELRNIIQLLVNAHKMWQVRALRLNNVLNTVMALPPPKRAALSAADLETLAEQVNLVIEAQVQEQAQEVEKKLESGDFVNAVRVYASQQFW